MNMSDGRRGRLRHADTVDGDVMGSMGMGGKAIVSVNGCVLCADFGTQAPTRYLWERWTFKQGVVYTTN